MKIKRFVTLIAMFIAGLAAVGVSQKTADAAYDYFTNNTKNYYGVTYQKFWAVDSALGGKANDAMYTWNSSNGTGIYTNMNMQSTNNRAQSIMDFVRSDRIVWISDTTVAMGETANDGRTGDAAWSSNWGCSTITIFNAPWGQNPSKQQACAAHEIGHALGLMHNEGWGANGSIMYPTVTKMTITGPTGHDMKGVKYLYG